MIKRVFCLVFTLLAVCGCVLSCSGRGSDGDICRILTELCKVGGDGGENKAIFYLDEAHKCENGDFRVLSKEDFGYLYDGIFSAPVCFERIEGYAIRMPLDDSGYEIHVVKCVNISDSVEVSQMLMRRVERMQSAEILDYAPESYEICFRGAIVYTRGRYVFLLATPDNEALVKEIKRLI